jgi:CYTH domain-containing protein
MCSTTASCSWPRWSSTTRSSQPELPDWLAPYVVREVTNESQYVNLNLAR